MNNVQKTDAEEARNQLPELLTATENGQVTIITRSGRPVAALIPFDVYQASPARQQPITHLKGTGRGMWGKDSRRFLRNLRAEWNPVNLTDLLDLRIFRSLNAIRTGARDLLKPGAV